LFLPGVIRIYLRIRRFKTDNTPIQGKD
jgi:hypothetical protein